MEEARQKVHAGLKLGYLIRAFPFHEESHQSSILVFGPSLQRIQWRILAAAHIGARTIAVAGGLVFELTNESLTTIESVQYYLYSSFLLLSIALQLCTYIFPAKVAAFHNSYHTLEARLGRIHHLEKNGANTANVILRWVQLAMWFGVVLACPVFTLSVKFNVHVFKLVNRGGIVVCMLVGAFMSYSTVVDLVTIFYYVSAVLIYCSTVAKCLYLSRYEFNAKASHRRKKALITFYLGHLILHYLMMQDLSILILLVIGLACGVLISSVYVVIQFWETMDALILVAAIMLFVVTFICMLIICRLASGLTELSIDFSRSYLSNEKRLSKARVLTYRSCRPLHIPVGPFFWLKRTTFPIIIQHVVAEMVISLIFSFE